MSRFRRVLCASALCLFASAWAAPAAAADVSAADREAARTYAEKGYESFLKGAHEQSMDFFRRAERLVHAPPHLLFIARSLAELGRLLESEQTYQRAASEELPPESPDAFRHAQATARLELEKVTARIPTIRIVVRGASASGAAVKLDGAEIAPSALLTEIRVDPGSHAVHATTDGAEVVERTFTVAEEARADRVEVVFEQRPRRVILPAAVAFGVGAVGLGVGAVTGILSVNEVSELEARCPDRRCLPGDEAIADSARSLGTVSTVGFVIGALGVVAGASLLVWQPQIGSVKLGAAPRGAPLRVGVGPGSLSIGGSF